MTDPGSTPTPARRRAPRARRTLLLAAAGCLAAAAATAVTTPRLFGSDHQDTPEVELNPMLDINDVWAFPGSSDARIVLAMTVGSPLTPAQTATARFDPNALYQIKIDNTGDAVEDLVIQVMFDDSTNAAGQVVGAQKVTVVGPVAPRDRGARNRLASATPTLTGAMGTAFGSATAIQAFAGVTDDPFYIDLEQFFRLVPDRRPSRGSLSEIGPGTATGFRPACVNGQPPANAAPFDGRRGCAVDYVRGLNALAIVVELPEAMVRGASAPDGRIGVWATVSR